MAATVPTWTVCCCTIADSGGDQQSGRIGSYVESAKSSSGRFGGFEVAFGERCGHNFMG